MSKIVTFLLASLASLSLLASQPVSAQAAPATPTLATAETCVNNDGTTCPDSYFNGPLGKRNPIPAGQGAFLITQYGGYGTWFPEEKQGIAEREMAMGRKYDVIQVHSGNKNPDTGENREQWALEHSRAGFIAAAWSPSRDMGAINQGAEDETIRQAARYYKKVPGMVMLRPYHEFNLPGSPASTACGESFKGAWQRTVRLFKEEGANNVGFWYVPDEGNKRDCVKDSYPGDEYVDWVGSDAYNWCPVGDGSCHATPGRSGPAAFGEVFDYSGAKNTLGDAAPRSQHDVFGSRKPFVIGETGSRHDTNSTTEKKAFFRSVPTDGKKMKYLRGVSFYDSDVSAVEGPAANFRVDAPKSDPGVYASYLEMTKDPFFNTVR